MRSTRPPPSPIETVEAIAVEEEHPTPAPIQALMSADLRPAATVAELTQRYANGDRNFAGTRLSNAEINDGRDLSGISLRHTQFFRPNFADAVLAGADMSNAAFLNGHFEEADLSNALLSNSSFHNGWFKSATMTGAKMSHSNFDTASFEFTNLDGASLNGAGLYAARFIRADLTDCCFDDAAVGQTVFVDVDLTPLCRARRLRHEAPSSVDVYSIIRSAREPGLARFLREAGTPQVFVDYTVECALSLDPNTVFSLMQSTFISYGGPDEPFADRLNQALRQEGVHTFFFRDDAVPGEKLHRVMRNGVNGYDRIVLICSKDSLLRAGVLNEIEETLAREARAGGLDCLIPIRLDDFVFTDDWAKDRADLRQTIRDRVVADFCGTQDDNDEARKRFDAQVARLASALRKK